MPAVVSMASSSASSAVGEPVRRGREPELFGRKAANAFAIHRESHGARRRNDLGETVALDIRERVGRDRFDLGNDELRPLLLDQPAKRRRVGHRDHVRAMRDLVAGRVRVAVDGDDLDAEALQRDDDFLAELAAAEQHDLGRPRRRAACRCGVASGLCPSGMVGLDRDEMRRFYPVVTQYCCTAQQ